MFIVVISVIILLFSFYFVVVCCCCCQIITKKKPNLNAQILIWSRSERRITNFEQILLLFDILLRLSQFEFQEAMANRERQKERERVTVCERALAMRSEVLKIHYYNRLGIFQNENKFYYPKKKF